MPTGPPSLESLEFRVLDVKIHAIQTPLAVEILLGWLDESPRRFRYVSSTNFHNIGRANETAAYRDVMENCDLSLPDGVPLLWWGRHLGFETRERCGIEEVMVTLFELSNQGRDLRHYFYGNTPEVLEHLRTTLRRRWPKLTIAGMRSPPFRPLTSEEDRADVEAIQAARPDFLWVSLGCPRQETWLFEHRERLGGMIGGGAGAVFDFIAGRRLKAPRLVQVTGLEWLLRLVSEPRRLWRRYLVLYPWCLYLLVRRQFQRTRRVSK